MFALKQLNFSS